MYLDNQNPNRSGWKYTYKGGELLPYAEAQLKLKCESARADREEAIRLARDPHINPSSGEVERAKRAMTASATVVEELTVYVHQFRRDADREFHLSTSDVVFFGLVSAELTEQVDQAITPRI